MKIFTSFVVGHLCASKTVFKNAKAVEVAGVLCHNLNSLLFSRSKRVSRVSQEFEQADSE